jgi:hypothetical protein
MEMKVSMTNSKKVIAYGIAGGVGFAVALAIISVIVFWYQSNPKPPKPWNKEAITASYDSVAVEGEKNHIVFYYTLQNNTDFDYKPMDLSNIVAMAKLKKQKSLSGQKNDEVLRPDYPILIPAKQRIRFAFHLGYPYNKSLKKDATQEEQEKYIKDIEAYVNEEFSNLDGFVLFDEMNRYQIEFPKGR